MWCKRRSGRESKVPAYGMAVGRESWLLQQEHHRWIYLETILHLSLHDRARPSLRSVDLDHLKQLQPHPSRPSPARAYLAWTSLAEHNQHRRQDRRAQVQALLEARPSDRTSSSQSCHSMHQSQPRLPRSLLPMPSPGCNRRPSHRRRSSNPMRKHWVV